MSEIDPKLLRPYNPEETEKRIYEKWEKSGYFNPDNLPERHKEPFTIIMPPPNANGHLHAGHALFITLEDIIIRFERMRGKKALWVPGADHAGFETQIVYEKKLEKEGRSRFKMKPEDLFEEIMAFTLENKKYMEDEVRQMGAGADWSREKFTLEPEITKKVQQTFKKMFDDGLVYRGKRIINWCSKHQTTLSDVETENVERKDPFYYFQYGPFVIGTARPETKFGDKHVVMHPDDARYKKYKHGETIDVEWINGPIKATIIKDEAIDMEFGTGVMTITPWHDATDFGIAERHNLEKEQIIDFRGKLLPIAQEFAGLKIKEARPKIIEKLKEKGLLVKIDENYVHNVPVCYKCQTDIEPQIMDQWFVKMKPLAEKALEAVNKKEIEFIPERYEKVFKYWMENTIDWNISRQIVWGIPIPAKMCESCGKALVDLENKVKNCPDCGNEMKKDTDTFDTWFSSGQWPLLALGYPDSKDFKTFYPTQVMETGHDLIFKWIPRMVIFGLYLDGRVPFKKVYLHGMVNDAQGKKMSKSKGNVIDPHVLTQKYGTDALRMALVVGNTPGTDMSLSEDKVKGYKHFANKIWNVSRFVMENTKDFDRNNKEKIKLDNYSEEKLARLKEHSKEVSEDFEKYRFYLAAEKLYHYFWHEFADIIIEESKERFKNPEEIKSTEYLLRTILETELKLLHPFMPFITEEIWSLFSMDDLLMIEKWPLK